MFRHFLSWKPLFYEALLPALSRLGPARADAILGGLGRLAARTWPPRGRELDGALDRLRTAYEPDQYDPAATRAELAANILRFLARDCPLDAASDAEAFARFDVSGFEHVMSAMAPGRGVILLGNHLGAYLAGVHWLYRRGVPLRLFVQRPQHLSKVVQAQFDRRDEAHPQTEFFLRRGLPPGLAAERMLRTRAALRDGLAVYMACDIPWAGPNARPGRLLGHTRAFLSVWADLAVLARAPVVPVFCTHRPGGRFALTFDPPLSLCAGDENEAVVRSLNRLDAEIAAQPADAVAHLLWPCYGPPASPQPSPRPTLEPGAAPPRSHHRAPRRTSTPSPH